MSAAVLREAAALMRSRAEAAMESPWRARLFNGEGQVVDSEDEILAVGDYEDMVHIASWHPAVALKVADLLDLLSELVDDYPSDLEPAVDLARTYLGSAS